MKLLILFTLLVGAFAEVARFDGYKVFQVAPKSVEEVKLLKQLEDIGQYDFWKNSAGLNASAYIMVAPHQMADFADIKKNFKESTVYIQDVQKLIDETSPKPTKSPRIFNWYDYHDGNAINAWLDNLVYAYPNHVRGIVAGQSYEGRPIKGVKLSFGPGRKAVFLEGGIHAREWVGPATVTFILNELLTSTNAAIRDIAQSYDWYVFPSVNPDGYAYTHSTNRLWRKTRRPYGLCYGADPNRNWGYHWAATGVSHNPCADTYCGPEAFSEIETRSVAAFVSTIARDLVAYIGFHSFSQFLLIPYGDSPAHVENYNELYNIGMKAAYSLSQRYGTQYKVGNIVEIIYPAAGGSMDWVKGVYHTPITYTYELRDTGTHGFLLPPDQIIPTGLETLDSLMTIMWEARRNGHV